MSTTYLTVNNTFGDCLLDKRIKVLQFNEVNREY